MLDGGGLRRLRGALRKDLRGQEYRGARRDARARGEVERFPREGWPPAGREADGSAGHRGGLEPPPGGGLRRRAREARTQDPGGNEALRGAVPCTGISQRRAQAGRQGSLQGLEFGWTGEVRRAIERNGEQHRMGATACLNTSSN